MRVVFFGTNTESLPAFHALLQAPRQVELVGVVTGQPKVVGRTQERVPTPVDTAAQEQGVPVWYFEDEKTLGILKEQHADVHIVVSFGAILKGDMLAIPQHGTINVHPSLLPKWRGPTPVQASIMSGDCETGVSIMLLDSKMDHGPLLWQSQPHILQGHEWAENLLQELMEEGARVLVETVRAYIAGDSIPQEQEHGLATTCKLLERNDGFLLPGTLDRAAWNALRAFTPWPGVWCIVNHGGKPTRIKILNAEPLSDTQEQPAPIHTLREERGHIIAGGLRILTWQWEGKSASPCEAFAVSHPEWSVELLPNDAQERLPFPVSFSRFISSIRP